jgi:N-acetylmuramoyl-L-alanine amidase
MPAFHRFTGGAGRWLLSIFLAWTSGACAFPIVVIDPGHGGGDRGTHWNGLTEKLLTLDVARRVETILRDHGVTTVMTRRTDRTVSLDDRARLANRFSGSLLVSIHFNANRITGISGHETFYRSEPGRRVAQSIQSCLAAALPGTDRGVTNNNFAVLTRTKGVAVLVECAFISNKAEAARCATPAHRQRIAEAIARGILRAR